MTMSAMDEWKAAWAQLISEQSPFAVVTANDGMRTFRDAPPSLLEAIQSGRKHGDLPFLKWERQHYSFNEFFAVADKLTATLQQVFRIQPGERIAIAMRNRPEWMITFVAAVQAGAVPVAVNSWSTQDELLYVMGDADVRMAFVDDRRCRSIDALSQGIDIVNVDSVSQQGRVLPWSRLCDGDEARPVLATVQPEDPAVMLYTSGTTKRAKGVLSSNRAQGQMLYALEFQGAFAAMTSPQRIQPIIDARLQPTALLAYPLFHVSGLHSQFLNALRNGRALVMLYKWDVETALDTIRDEQITQFAGVPTMMQQLLAHPRFASSDTDSLRSLGLGGGAASRVLLQKLLSIKPLAMSGSGYGMTEANGMCAAHSGEQFVAFPSSSGWPLPIADIRIAETLDQPLDRGQSGPIWLRAPTLMQRYWNRPEENAACIEDGWFFTGDVGYLDADGMLYITDRIKDIIIRGGENISALEVEYCASEHPAVEEAAVFRLPDDELGESVAMVVYTNAELTRQQLLEHMAKQLAAYKLPETIWFTDRPLQRSATGKLLKTELKKAFVATPEC